jgi:NifU-like protein involved in Fe-S cluster formation
MNITAAHSLYSRDILQLAMALPHNDTLTLSSNSATCRAPLCGSEMTVDVAMDRGVVGAIAIRAKACALGQASAAILRTVAIGQSTDAILQMQERVILALAGQSPMPQAFETFAYAQDYPARHGAILLPFETLIAAIAAGKN